ncbi:MAG: GNAT family protein [Pseudomonadota bacterium]
MTVALPQQICTKRLVLREPQITDAAQIFSAYTHSAEVAQYMVWRPHTKLVETEAFIVACIEAWHTKARYPFVLALHGAETKPIGMIEVRPQTNKVDIGYVLAPAYWGQGLVPEALIAVAEECLAQPDIFRVQATCDVENKASIRALEKAGFLKEGRLERYTVHPNISAEPRPCFMYARCR